MYSENTIKEYLTKLASRDPVPGGGSAAALTGAAGAALICKVANFTIGKDEYKAVESDMKDVLNRAGNLRERFLKLCSDDAAAYEELSGVLKEAKGNDRAARLEGAFKKAAGVPLETCRSACEAVKFCASLREKGNKNLMSDVDCANLMLKCAFETALINVEINLKGIKDTGFTGEAREKLRLMKKDLS